MLRLCFVVYDALIVLFGAVVYSCINIGFGDLIVSFWSFIHSLLCTRSYGMPFFFSSRRRHTRLQGDWSSDVCSSDLEGAGLGLGELRKDLRPRQEFVAVGARQPLDAFFLQQRIQLSTGAAVSVDDEDLRVASTVRLDLGAHRRRDALGPIVQLRGQAAHIEIGPAIGALERCDLAGESPAGDEQGVRALVHVVRPQAARVARRAASRVLAVSTAIAASRQYASAPTALPNSSFSGAPPTSTM